MLNAGDNPEPVSDLDTALAGVLGAIGAKALVTLHTSSLLLSQRERPAPITSARASANAALRQTDG